MYMYRYIPAEKTKTMRPSKYPNICLNLETGTFILALFPPYHCPFYLRSLPPTAIPLGLTTMSTIYHSEPLEPREKLGEILPDTAFNSKTLDKSNNTQDVSACTSQTAVSCIDPEKQITQPGSGVEPPPRDINGFKWVLVITAILSSIFLYALDATVVADIQPVIVKEFNSLENLTWLGVGFLLGATATNLLWGKIYGQFNAKWTYIFCVAFFEVGSAICGVS